MRKEVIGAATLYLGDCREILPTLGSVAAVITDPPFSVSIAGSKSIGPKGMRNLDFFAGDTDWRGMREVVRQSIAACCELSPGTMAVWCGHRQIGVLVDQLEDAGYSTRPIFWRKTCPPPAPPGAGFSSACEQGIYAYKPGRFWGGGQYEANVFDADSLRHGNLDKTGHPTQKPLALMKWNVRLLVPPGGTILDPYMGSGTTGVAALQMGHPFIGIEIEPRYFDIACRRIEAAQRQADMFVSPPPLSAIADPYPALPLGDV